jgi:rhamnosyltransferase
MNPVADATAAVLVVYRQVAAVPALLDAVNNAVGCVVVVDNSEHGHASLLDLVHRHRATLIQGGNVGALAGAYNRALDHLRSLPHPPQHVVFLDDDSDPGVLGALLADAEAQRLLVDPTTAAVAPAYRDRATGLRGRYIMLGRFRLTHMARQFGDLRPVAFLINSMSVWRMAALDRIGRFNEGLAIDHVDTEYCLRARQAGLSTYVHGKHEFAHAIGQRTRFRFLGREMQAGGHAPARRYLIGRNTAWLARDWLWREPAFAALCVLRLAYETVGIVAAEDQAWTKLGALWRGAGRGLLMPRAR